MALVEFQNNSAPYINATNLNKIQERNVYSTNEVVIGKWVDNKPIYKKTFTGSLIDGAILIQNIGVLVNAYGSGNYEGGIIRQLPYYEFYNNNNYIINVSVNNNEIRFGALVGGSPTTVYNVALTLEYTKTTD